MKNQHVTARPRNRFAAACLATALTVCVSVLAAAALFSAAPTPAAAAPAAAPAVSAQAAAVQAAAGTGTVIEYWGAIRCTGGKWAALNDSGHRSQGITSVTATSTYVQVNHAHVDKIFLTQYTGDNDYPRFGIFVTGASASYNYDRFFFRKNGAAISPAAACDLQSTNVWVYGMGLDTP